MTEGDWFDHTLTIDGIYFLEAKHMAELAAAEDKDFSKGEKHIFETQQQMLDILNDSSRDDEEVHDLDYETYQHWQSGNYAATKLIRKVSAVHILCAASLEAHINIRAEQILNEEDFEKFDKLSIIEKWLSYPLRISVGSFDRGKKPFQDFQRLIRRRNALVHYKVRRAKTRNPYEIPRFVDELGLRAAASTESVTAVSSMVRELAKMENCATPDWVDSDRCLAFETD